MENNVNFAAPIVVDNPVVDAEADKIIKRHAMLATGAGLIPLFGLDIAAVTAVQVSMAQRLAEVYNVPYEDYNIRIIISSGVASLFSRFTSYGIREFFNSFETFGHIADELTNAAASGFFTAAFGEVYKQHFKQGLGFDTLNFSHYFSYFKEQIEEGHIGPNTFRNVSSGFGYLIK